MEPIRHHPVVKVMMAAETEPKEAAMTVTAVADSAAAIVAVKFSTWFGQHPEH